MYATCGATTDCVLGLQCFQSEVFACMNQLAVCAGNEDPAILSCIAEKGWT